MTAVRYSSKFIATIEEWEYALSNYSEEAFKIKPDNKGWSLGQVYWHLAVGTMSFQLKEIEKCLSGNENQTGSKAMPAKLTFLFGSFPPIKIKVPPSETYTPKQPENKEYIKQKFAELKTKINELAILIDKSEYHGKTKHPAFGYLSAIEWYKLIEMHFRHHEGQRARLAKQFTL